MGTLTPTKLVLISERARREPDYQFTSLAHLLDAGFLKACYFELGRDRASGMDGVSWKEYGERLEENLANLVTRMKVKRYQPQPVRRVYIPKDEHTVRPLGLPALEDKIVQKGIARILEAIYEQDFLECSHGFRPGQNCHQALSTVNMTFTTRPINHVIEADIKGFFDHVSHEWLKNFLGVRIKDPSLLLLIQKVLKAGVIEAGEYVETEEGTPQGGNLSPLLSNVFLHYVLDLWFEKKIKPRIRGECHLVRYADDFIVMVRYADDAKFIAGVLRERFAEFGLELHPDKTRVISFGRYEPENAKRQNRKTNSFDFLGFTHYCGRSRKGNFLLGRKTSGTRFRKKCKEMKEWLKAVRNAGKAKEWWPTLEAKLRGHYQYYGVSGNFRSIRRFLEATRRMTWKWLNRRSQRKSFSRKRFWEYLDRYPLPKPRVMHNFYTLSFGS
jgi:group II intron reverse transcriptase/maturase